MRTFVLATFFMNVLGVALNLIQATRAANRRDAAQRAQAIGYWMFAMGFGLWAFWAGSVLWPIK